MNSLPVTDEPYFDSIAWDQHFQRLARRVLGLAKANNLLQRYFAALTIEYKHLVSPRYALKDILQLNQLTQIDRQHVGLVPPCANVMHYRLHFYSQQPHYLDEYIPILENLALRVMDQVQFQFVVNGVTQYVKSFTVKTAHTQAIPLYRLKAKLLSAIVGMLKGLIENDALNKLLVLTGLAWREIDLLRAYRNYYLQIHHQTTSASIHRALLNYPAIALCLFNYFEARFRPKPEWDDAMLREDQALAPLRLQLLSNLASVNDLNDDRILRTLFNVIDATVRCNFHWRQSMDDYFLAFKIDSLGIIDLPAPKPQNEIYVHAINMQGIHLRAGKIARGGIRWSDRPDDFRLEILGLMQTQVSKNALIIPTGSKGGFVLKHSVHADLKAAGKKAYITLIRGLLDLTDNYVNNQAVLNSQIVSYDDPDPYLVVAADKGTASFPDIANAVAAEYQFWLGDAFASGGSQGYDHKALGITARGAWECVKRHFRELGKNIQQEDFSVVGIGSMDGDVFGNGMLLSPHIRLLAAFSGQHIFLDPNPLDTDAALQERKRLFELSGSTWHDYRRDLISPGGGVYARSAKDIILSPEIKEWLGIRYKVLDGESLIRYVLTAQVDLLWLGGIGTYVKASYEKHEEVGDRSNDTVRVDAIDLKALVVGEGANLGFTQKARIEYQLAGGRINTDAVDNSAGVDTSDHEVNLKILLSGLQQQGVIDDYHVLFMALTDDVCQKVLANNYAQSLCLSLEQLRNSDNPSLFLDVADKLAASGFFDKGVESFASNRDILNRSQPILTRPELAVVMAASKMYLTQKLQNASTLLPESTGYRYLQQYFPEPISHQYSAYLMGHSLAANIIATVISNTLINQAGCGFLKWLDEHESITALAYSLCYLTLDTIVAGSVFRQSVYALDNKLSTSKQYTLLLSLERALQDTCQWVLLQGKTLASEPKTIESYQRYLEDYARYSKQHSPRYKQQLIAALQEGLNDTIAQSIALFSCLQEFPLIVELAMETKHTVASVLDEVYATQHYLKLDMLLLSAIQVSILTDWERKLVVETMLAIQQSVAQLVKRMLIEEIDCTRYFSSLVIKPKIERYWRLQQELQSHMPVTLVHYLVLEKALTQLL